MFQLSSAPIDTFKNMYYSEGNYTILVGSDAIYNIPISASIISNKPEITVNPNPANSFVNVTSNNTDILKVEVYSADGQKHFCTQKTLNQHNTTITLPDAQGFYFLRIYTNEGIITRKILKAK